MSLRRIDVDCGECQPPPAGETILRREKGQQPAVRVPALTAPGPCYTGAASREKAGASYTAVRSAPARTPVSTPLPGRFHVRPAVL